MPETLTVVASIFGLIGIGYGAARLRLLDPAVADALLDFLLKIAIPFLVFGTIANADLQGISPWRIWAAYFVPFAVVWVAADQLVRRGFGRDARAGVVAGGSAAFSNSVLIGLPLVQAAFGERGVVYLIIIVSIHLPIMMLVSIVLNEWAQRTDGVEQTEVSRGEALRRLALTLATHPILLAILAGVLWRVSGLAMPGVLAVIVDALGRPAGPLALVVSGMSLVSYGMARQIGPAFAVAALKLLLLPLLVLGAAQLVGLPPIGVAAVTLTAAGPTGVNAFLVAAKLGTGQALASNALLISTAGGVVTVTLWLLFLERMLA